MKKWLLLIVSIVMAISFCACGNKEVEENNVDSSENEVYDNSSGEEEIDDYYSLLDLYLNNTVEDEYAIKTGKDKLTTIDINFAKEYYNILLSYEDNYEAKCMTIDNENGFFPYLLIFDGNELVAYEYKDGSAKKIDASTFKVDTDAMAELYDGVFTYESVVFEQGYLHEFYKGIKDSGMSLEDCLKTYSGFDDVGYYGTSDSSYEDLDGNKVSILTDVTYEDGKLYVEVTDSSADFNKKVEVLGIEDKIIYGETVLSSDYAVNHPEVIYELTNKGELYRIDMKGFYSIEGETINAKKIDGVKNIIAFDSVANYPATIDVNGMNDDHFYGFTYDGELIKLED